ncbi:sensor histidine kinase [Cyclobacterium marinum]|uniref:sensor histidine kinase n=1 Tax=Cyclobacterium marinum TaxID=104 RepID=UPI0011ECB25D|nr:sensor histidine kinase [Cyclobacterium marinum]MBI0399991.1 sensor histidine kinase [Cyclobacterium marinum]
MLISITLLWGSYIGDAFQRKFRPVWLLLVSEALVIMFFVANINSVNLNETYFLIPDILLIRIALTAQILLIAIGWILRQQVIRDAQEKLTVLHVEQQKAFWDAERELQDLKISSLSINNELYGQREHLARDLHDGIGSQLTHIISRLDILSLADNSQQKHLQQLRDFTRDTNQYLRETIWILNKKEVTCSQFALRLHGFLQNLWEDEKYPQLKWHCSNPSENINLSPEVAVHLMRLTQEAIANIIKHAQADEIVVELRINPPQINLVIKDNGIGFDPEKSSYGFGLENMRQRVAEMGGGLDLKSGNFGTEIQVTIPVTT